MEGVTGIADDMVIAGRDEMEHDRNFLAFMGKCMEDTGIFLWPLLVKAWDFTRSKEDTGTETYGIPTRQGNHKIFPRYDQLPQKVLCTQCTPCCTPQYTHTPGYRLQVREGTA